MRGAGNPQKVWRAWQDVDPNSWSLAPCSSARLDAACCSCVQSSATIRRRVKGTVAGARKIESLRGARLGNPCLRRVFGEVAVIGQLCLD